MAVPITAGGSCPPAQRHKGGRGLSDIVLNGKNDGDGVRMSWVRAAAIVAFLVGFGVFTGRMEGRMTRQDERIAEQTAAINALTRQVAELTTAVEVLKVAPPRVDSEGRILR